MVQVVRVKFLGAQQLYSYIWRFYPADGGTPLQVGERVEVPPNWMNPEGGSGTVAELGSDYAGQMADIVRRIS